MDDNVYDVPISEAVEILEKSDRQVRRYVRDKLIKAIPLRVQGHVKLMFNREELVAFKERLAQGGTFGKLGYEGVAHVRSGEDNNTGSAATHDVKDASIRYVVDALLEQIRELRKENQELYYQLEQRSGQVGFLQAKVETLKEELKMLMPPQKEREEVVKQKPWYKRLFARG